MEQSKIFPHALAATAQATRASQRNRVFRRQCADSEGAEPRLNGLTSRGAEQRHVV